MNTYVQSTLQGQASSIYSLCALLFEVINACLLFKFFFEKQRIWNSGNKQCYGEFHLLFAGRARIPLTTHRSKLSELIFFSLSGKKRILQKLFRKRNLLINFFIGFSFSEVICH
jgi:hypothetical protein